MGVPDDVPRVIEPALEDVAFLSTSPNRMAILCCLREQPHSRHVLTEMTGVSRVTLARILDDLEERNWITQAGTRSEITPLGAWVCSEFIRLCEVLAEERTLRPVVPWFPPGGFGFPISALTDAEITLRTQADPTAPVGVFVRELESMTDYRAFSFSYTEPWFETTHERTLNDGLSWEWVTTPEVIQVLRADPRLSPRLREVLETGRAQIYTNEDVNTVVLFGDDRVLIRLVDDDQAPAALITATHPDVWAWAEDTFTAYKTHGEPVDPTTFADTP